MRPVVIVQGAQYGSEAKGAITSYICDHEGVDFAVRTGATNAGHTVYYKGVPYKMQQLPCGWTNPMTKLVVGAGSLVDLAILRREIRMLEDAGVEVLNRLFVDYRAYVHEDSAAVRSADSGRHHRIGATGKGCSEAYMDRIRLRGIRDLTISRYPGRDPLPVFDTVILLNRALDDGALVLLEGTQGTLLDVTHGPYPYTTHKQTLPSTWLGEAGIATTVPQDVVLVARTYPIRVAGNSGPLPGEMSWPMLARTMNATMRYHHLEPVVDEWALVEFENALRNVAILINLPIELDPCNQHEWSEDARTIHASVLSELNKTALNSLEPATLAQLSRLFEFTTVTRKLRRVANLSTSELGRAAMLCRPTRVAMTFMNYVWPQHDPNTDHSTSQLTRSENLYLARVADVCRAPVTFATWGPESRHIQKVSVPNGRK